VIILANLINISLLMEPAQLKIVPQAEMILDLTKREISVIKFAHQPNSLIGMVLVLKIVIFHILLLANYVTILVLKIKSYIGMDHASLKNVISFLIITLSQPKNSVGILVIQLRPYMITELVLKNVIPDSEKELKELEVSVIILVNQIKSFIGMVIAHKIAPSLLLQKLLNFIISVISLVICQSTFGTMVLA